MMTGRLTKDSAEVRRVTVDFSLWCDTSEVISAVSTPAIVIEPFAVRNLPAGVPIFTPPDTTPLTLYSAVLISAQQVQLMLQAGTPGLTYKLTFLATGSTSLRQHQCDLLITVRGPI